MKSNHTLILIGVSVVVILILFTIATPLYLRTLDDNLAIINYVCITGFKPSSFGGWEIQENGTHVIDMETCKWMTLEDNKKWHSDRGPPQIEVGREGALLNDTINSQSNHKNNFP